MISKFLNIVGTLASLFLITWSVITHSYAYLGTGIVLLISNIGQIKSAGKSDEKAM